MGKKGKKNQLTITSFVCADNANSEGVHTNEIWGAGAALPGRITQGKDGKCAN